MYLLDTHTLLWLDTDPSRLTQSGLAILKNPQTVIYVSSVSAWELGIKHRLGKLPSAAPLLASYHSSLAHYGFSDLAFTSRHALAEQYLTQAHKDPFDRALVAQAMCENLVLISNDMYVQAFSEITTLW